MTPEAMKETFAELNRHVDPSYVSNNIGKIVEIFSHINDLLDAELEGRLMITPCEVTPIIKYKGERCDQVYTITKNTYFEWMEYTYYPSKKDYDEALKKIGKEEYIK